MPGFKARRAEIGDLVLLIAVALQHLGGVAVHVRLLIVVGQDGRALVFLIHGRARLELESVDGDVLRVQLYDPRQGLGPVALGLAGQAVHEIHAHVVKARQARVVNGLLRLLEVVAAADELEEVIVRCLHADREAVDALLAQQPHGVEADAVGVTLHGDLRVEAHVAIELQLVKEVDDPVCPVVARGAAAEIDRVHLVLTDGMAGLVDMLQQRLMVFGHARVAAGERIEIAVAALAGAEGDMDIDSQFWSHVQSPTVWIGV